MECDVLGIEGEEVSLTASSRQPTASIDPVPMDTYKGRSLWESCRDFSDEVSASLAQGLYLPVCGSPRGSIFLHPR